MVIVNVFMALSVALLQFCIALFKLGDPLAIFLPSFRVDLGGALHILHERFRIPQPFQQISASGGGRQDIVDNRSHFCPRILSSIELNRQGYLTSSKRFPIDRAGRSLSFEFLTETRHALLCDGLASACCIKERFRLLCPL